jgi:hypothetical protein
MPSPGEIAKLATQLHEAKLVNLDASAVDFIGNNGLQVVDPAQLAGWYVVGGEHYVVVCGITDPGAISRRAELG